MVSVHTLLSISQRCTFVFRLHSYNTSMYSNWPLFLRHPDQIICKFTFLHMHHLSCSPSVCHLEDTKLMKTKTYQALLYAVFSRLLMFLPCQVRIFFSPFYSPTQQSYECYSFWDPKPLGLNLGSNYASPYGDRSHPYKLTLRLLMSYIYGAPSKARNANVVYIWTYVWQR